VAAGTARLHPADKVTVIFIPIPYSFGGGIALGPDQNIWVADFFGDRIRRVAANGIQTEYPVTPGRQPQGIAAGPDGNLWFTEHYPNIGRITPTGAITDFPLPRAVVPPSHAARGITAGPDGNLWFAEPANGIGRITTAGVVTEFPVPTANSEPSAITAGPDGNVWFTELTGNRIGRITPAAR